MKKGGLLYCDECGERVDPKEATRHFDLRPGRDHSEKVWHHECAQPQVKTVFVKASS